MSVLKGSPRAIISIIALAMMVITPAAFATGTSQDDHKSSCGGKHESSSKSYSSSSDKCDDHHGSPSCKDDDRDGHGETKYAKSYRVKSSDDKCKPHKAPKDDDCDDSKYSNTKSYKPSHKDDDCPKPPPVKPPTPPVPPVVPPAPPVVPSTPPAPAQPAVVPPTLISVHKVALKPTVKVGKSVTWRIVVINDSNKSVTVTVKDVIPGALALSKVPLGAKLNNGTLTFVVTMSAHSKKTFVVSTRLTAKSVRKVCNIASATADGSATKRSRACVKILKKVIPPRVPVTG